MLREWRWQRGLRRSCDGALAALRLPDRGVGLESVRERVQEVRGRRVQLTPISGLPGVHGLWLSSADVELVLYADGTTPWHQHYTVCHEFAHMLLGHDEQSGAPGEDRHVALPDIAPETVRSVLRRSAYDTWQEQEAEYLAMRIMQRIERASALPPVSPGISGVAAVRLLQALGDES